MLAQIGRKTIQFAVVTAEILELALGAFHHAAGILSLGRRAVVSVFLRQVYFTAFQALPIVTLLSLLLGISIIMQIIRFAGHGNEVLTGNVLVWVVVRAAGPILAAIITVARSGTAIATELGAMRVAGEVDSLRQMGIDPDRYLVMPRVLGTAISVLLLSVHFEMAALLGGMLVAALVWSIPFDAYALAAVSALTLTDLAVSLTKAGVFGLGIGAICCLEGMRVSGGSLTEVPQSATRAVMRSLLFIFLMEGVFALPAVFMG